MVIFDNLPGYFKGDSFVIYQNAIKSLSPKERKTIDAFNLCTSLCGEQEIEYNIVFDDKKVVNPLEENFWDDIVKCLEDRL